MANVAPPKLLGSYDYYSPFATASLFNKVSGKRFPLTPSAVKGAANTLTVSGTTAGGMKEYSLDFMPFLTQISVHIDAGTVPRITATLNPPLDLARALIDPAVNVFEWGGISELEVQFGYSAGKGTSKERAVSPIFRGLILQPSFSYSGDDFSITFEAQGSGGWILATTAGGEKTTATTGIGVIEELCKKLNVSVETDVDDTARALLNQEIGGYVVGSMTLLSAIYDIARRCGCNIYLRDETDRSILTVRSLGKIILQEPVGTLALFSGLKESIGPTKGVYPILSVSTDNTAVFLSSQIKTTFQASIQPNGKVTTTTAAPGSTPTTNTGAAGINTPSAAASSAPANGKGQGSPDKAVPADIVKQQVEQAMLKASTENGQIGMKLEIETLGFPEVQPGLLLSVVGLGARFDGNYVVMEVNHEYSSSGFSTNLTVVSNASKIWGALRDVIPSSAPNTSTSPAPASANAGGATGASGGKTTVPSQTQSGSAGGAR